MCFYNILNRNTVKEKKMLMFEMYDTFGTMMHEVAIEI